jgi:hypothetical protein
MDHPRTYEASGMEVPFRSVPRARSSPEVRGATPGSGVRNGRSIPLRASRGSGLRAGGSAGLCLRAEPGTDVPFRIPRPPGPGPAQTCIRAETEPRSVPSTPAASGHRRGRSVPSTTPPLQGGSARGRVPSVRAPLQGTRRGRSVPSTTALLRSNPARKERSVHHHAASGTPAMSVARERSATSVTAPSRGFHVAPGTGRRCIPARRSNASQVIKSPARALLQGRETDEREPSPASRRVASLDVSALRRQLPCRHPREASALLESRWNIAAHGDPPSAEAR